MSIIKRLDNTASIVYNCTTINSNTVTTLLLLPPTIFKTVDKLSANIGDTLTYTVTIKNISMSPISDLPFLDALPDGASYVTDSFAVNGSPTTPAISGNTLSYTIPSIPASGTAIVTFQVLVEGTSD